MTEQNTEVEQEGSETTDETQSGEEQTVSSKEFKAVQQALSKRDTELRTLRKQLAENSTLSSSERDRQDGTIGELIKILSSNELFEGVKSQVLDIETKNTRARSINESNAQYLGQLQDAIGDDNFNTDDKYAEARALHNAGRYSEVLAEVRRTNQEPLDRESIISEARVAVMKELGRTDTGTSTAGPTLKSSEWQEQWNNGTLPPTKENMSKARLLAGGDEPLL